MIEGKIFQLCKYIKIYKGYNYICVARHSCKSPDGKAVRIGTHCFTSLMFARLGQMPVVVFPFHWFFHLNVEWRSIMKVLKKQAQFKLNILMVVIAWISILFLGKGNFRKFFPSSLFSVLFEAFTGLLGKKKMWWIFYNKPQSFFFNELPYYIGPFIAASLWIQKLTFGKFKRYVAVNAIFNALFAFPFTKFATKYKYFSLVKMNSFTLFLHFFYKSFILYGVQYLFQKNYKPVK